MFSVGVSGLWRTVLFRSRCRLWLAVLRPCLSVFDYASSAMASPGATCPYSASLSLCILWHLCFSVAAYSPAQALPSAQTPGSTPRPHPAWPLRARCRRQRAAAHRSRRPPLPGCRAGPSRAELPGALLRALRVRKTQFNISLKNKNKQTKKQQRNRNIRTQNTKNHKINRYLLRVVNISIGKVWFLCSSDFPLLSLEGSNLKLQGKFWKTGQRSTSSPRALGLSMVGSCLFSSAKIACISLAGHWV